MTPRFEPTQEVRFAIVMYGGVSLAIYINGVAQELLHLVRATAPREAASDTTFPDTLLLAEVEGTEAVYRKLGQLLEARERPPEQPRANEPGDDDPVLTRFVVDILSGSSAGGINGIFLAKALANELPIKGLKRLWVEEGDLAMLLQDERSYADLPQTVEREQPPESLLNTGRMYWQIFKALEGMHDGAGGQEGDSPLVDELDLWITTTDVHGLVLPIDLYDSVVFEARYRQVFRFSYLSEYAGGGARRNQLTQEFDPVLAFAARATSSFPFAFEPMALDDVGSAIGRSVDEPTWRHLFRDYKEAGESPAAIGRRPFVDGGYLDNKPFTWSTDGLQRRQSDLPVDRKLIYVEPDPGSLHALRREEGQPLPQVRRNLSLLKPDAIASSLLAFTLPRKEQIRDDLDRLLERNRVLARAQNLIRQLEQAPQLTEAWKSLDRQSWLAQTPETLAAERGPHYLAYSRLKLAMVLDDLAEVGAMKLGFDPNTDERSAIRCFLEPWFALTHQSPAEQNQFLLDLDLSFRLRRIVFVQHRVDELLRRPEGAGSGSHDALRELRRSLNGHLVRLRRAGRGQRGLDQSLADAVGPLLDRQQLLSVLADARNEAESIATARAILEANPQLLETITRLSQAVADGLHDTLVNSRVRDEIESAAAATPELAPVLDAYDRFEAFDAVTLPISYAQTGEANRVEVIRISPEDATEIRDEVKTDLRKLGGIEVGHFGGFLHEAWRKNDLLWGRLDAAERIVMTLLRSDEATEQLRKSLVQQAHRTIVREEFGLTTDAEADEAIERLRTQDIERDLPPQELVPLVRRAIAVSGAVFGGIGAGRDAGAVSRLVARVGGAAAGLAQAATRTPWWIIFPALAPPALLIALGIVLGWPAAARIGWSLVPWVVVAWALLVVLGRRIDGIKLPRAGGPPRARAAAPVRASMPLEPPGFPTDAEAAAAGRGRQLLPFLALVGVFLLLIFPFSLLNSDISAVVSWLPGWK
jgi:patatin-related protein